MKKIHFLILFLALTSFLSNAQVSSYVFTRNGGMFDFLSASGAVITEHTVYDDVVIPATITIPFLFKFGNDTQSTLGISENGFIWFGSSQPADVPFIEPLSTPQSPFVQGIVSALGIDLHPTITSLATTKISSAVLGQAPNRTLVIEWRDTARIQTIDHPSGPDIIDFQIRLSETTNEIVIAFGRCILNPNFESDAEVGLKKSPNDFNLITTNNALWSNPLLGTSLNDKCTLSSLSKPAFGHKYSWKPLTLGVDDFDTSQVVLYPNPASDIIHIQGLEQETIDYIIYDVTGRLIKKNRVQGTSILIDELASGNYLIKILSGNLEMTRKIVKI